MQLWSAPLVIRMSETQHQDGISDHRSSTSNGNRYEDTRVDTNDGGNGNRLLNGYTNDGGNSSHLGTINADSNSPTRRRLEGLAEAQHEEHARFVAALERHGDWRSMALDLGWSLEDVQVYAFRYMNALRAGDAANCQGESSNDNGSRSNSAAPASTPHEARGGALATLASPSTSNNLSSVEAPNVPLPLASPPWCLEESILFDNLVALYHPATAAASGGGAGMEGNQIPGNWQTGWEHLVAAHLPGRTALEVRQRYRTYFLEGATRQAIQDNGIPLCYVCGCGGLCSHGGKTS